MSHETDNPKVMRPEDGSRDTNQISSRDLAALIVDALVDAGYLTKDVFDQAVAVVAEEIDVRKALGDY